VEVLRVLMMTLRGSRVERDWNAFRALPAFISKFVIIGHFIAPLLSRQTLFFPFILLLFFVEWSIKCHFISFFFLFPDFCGIFLWSPSVRFDFPHSFCFWFWFPFILTLGSAVSHFMFSLQFHRILHGISAEPDFEKKKHFSVDVWFVYFMFWHWL